MTPILFCSNSSGCLYFNQSLLLQENTGEKIVTILSPTHCDTKDSVKKVSFVQTASICAALELALALWIKAEI